MTANYTPTGPFTNGAAPGISAAFLNAIEAMFAPKSSTTFVGKYFLQGGAWDNGSQLSTYTQLNTQNGSTPVSVSIDTADQAPAASAGTPSAGLLSANGFQVISTCTAASNTARAGGNFTVQY